MRVEERLGGRAESLSDARHTCSDGAFVPFIYERRLTGAQIDLSREYWLRVFEPSLREWASGLSPNPDVWCNK